MTPDSQNDTFLDKKISSSVNMDTEMILKSPITCSTIQKSGHHIKINGDDEYQKLPSISDWLSKLPSAQGFISTQDSSPQKRQRSEYDMLLFAQYPTQIANIYKNSRDMSRSTLYKNVRDHVLYPGDKNGDIGTADPISHNNPIENNNAEDCLLNLANIALCMNSKVEASEVSRIMMSRIISRSRSIAAKNYNHGQILLSDNKGITNTQDSVSVALIQNYSQKQKKRRVHMCKWDNCYRIFPSLSRLLRHEKAHSNNNLKQNQHKEIESNSSPGEKLTWNIQTG